MDKIIKFYRGYLDRNETFEEFGNDVHTLGGSFEGGWIGTTKEKVTIQDKEFKIICEIKLKEIWRLGKVNQTSLF